MTRRSMIPTTASVAQAVGQTQQSSNRDRLIGAWRLLSLEMLVNGTIQYPLGEHPIERLTYDAAGRISAQLMKSGRESVITDPRAVARATEDELRQITDGYFGSFEVDGSAVTHHIEACNLPAWTGTDQKRHLEFAGGHSILRFGPNKLV